MSDWRQQYGLPTSVTFAELIFVGASAITTLRVVLDLDVPNKVPHNGGIPLAELASLVGVDPSKLIRLLRLLFGLGLFKESEPGSGQILHTRSMRFWAGVGDLVKLITSPLSVLPEQHLTRALHLSLSENQPPTAAYLALDENWYDALTKHPEWLGLDTFYAALITLANAFPLIQCHELWQVFADANVPVVELASGLGHFGIALAEAYPGLQVELQDREVNRPEVEKRIPIQLGGRVRFRDHDFFTPQPNPWPNGVAYLMQWTLHNLQAEQCVAVLRHLIPGLKNPLSRLLIGEQLLPDPGSVPTFEELSTLALDLKMLTLFDAEERTQDGFDKLFRQADPALKIVRVWAKEHTRMRLLEVCYDAGVS